MHWLFLSLENGCQFGLMLLHVSVPKSRHHSVFVGCVCCGMFVGCCGMFVGCCGLFVGCCGMFVGCCGMFVGCCGMCVGCWNVCWSDDGESAVGLSVRVRVPDIRLSRDRDAVRHFLAVRVRFMRKGLDRVAVTFLLVLCQDSVRVRSQCSPATGCGLALGSSGSGLGMSQALVLGRSPYARVAGRRWRRFSSVGSPCGFCFEVPC